MKRTERKDRLVAVISCATLGLGLTAWAGPAPDARQAEGVVAAPAAPRPGNATAEPENGYGIPRGYMIVEGDIVVPVDFYETLATRGVFAPNLWPGGTVPYQFAAGVTGPQQAGMLVAMADWKAVSGVDFVPRAGEVNYINIGSFGGNWSFVGRRGGGQDLSISSWGSEFIMAHELAHALGIWHEQSRTDRNAFVTIDLTNVCQTCCSGGSCDHNFAIVATSTAHGPYDYDSVMHYSQCAFSVCGACPNDGGCANDGKTVIAPSPIGQKTHLSNGDEAVMAFLYGSASCGNGVVDSGEDCDPPDGQCCSATCQYEAPNTLCGDSTDNDCTDRDTCNASGTCMSNHASNRALCPNDLGGGGTDNDCTNPDTCDSGVCRPNHASNGALCPNDLGGSGSDTDCTDPDTCDGAGACLDNHEPGGTACGDPTDTNCDNPDTCDGAGACLDNYEPADTPCPDGLWCNGDELCDGAGTCLPDDPRCSDGIECTTDPCNEFTDECEAPVPHDALCDDGDVCTGVETCNTGTGDPVTGCLAGVPPDCDDGNPCTDDSCDPTAGCLHSSSAPGTSCSNGLWCDGDETCDDAGTCLPGTQRCDDGIACTSDPCNEADDVCESPFPHDELCDDGVGCTNDTCDLVNDCQFTPDDSNCDDGVGCTNDTCNLVDDCQFTPDDSKCEDEFDCTDDTCDLVNDCQFTPNDSKCDNDLFCDGAEICDPVRNPVDGCIDGTLPCDDGIDCTKDCDEDADACMSDPDPIDCGTLTLNSHADDQCFKSAEDVCVTIDVSDLDGQAMTGGQFFIKYDACLFEVADIAPGDHPSPDIAPCAAAGESPFSAEIFRNVVVDGCVGTIEYAVGLPLGGDPSAADNTMATIHFVTLYPDCSDCHTGPIGQGCGDIDFWLDHDPPTRLTDYLGTPNDPAPVDAIPKLTVDDNAPVFGDNDPDFDNWCSDIDPVPNDPGECSAAIGVIPCAVEDAGIPENPGCGLCEVKCVPSGPDDPFCVNGLPRPAPYPVGTTCITWLATDCAGNEATHVQCVTVNDIEDPTITCPADMTQTADPGECGAIVTYPDPVVGDNCPDPTWVCDHPSGSFFDVGDTTVCCSATDAAGNRPDECCFTVTVTDDELPSVTCPADKTVATDPGVCSAIVDPGPATCTDNCDCTVTCERSDGLDCFTDRYLIGDTVLTWTATDPSGNSTSCQQTITVEDREPPKIQPMSDIKVSNDLNQCHAVVTWGDPVVSDNCPGVTWSCEPPSGSMFDVGDTTVTCTATDAAGNTSEVSFVVIVNDTEFPRITCPADKSVGTDPGECEADVDPGMANCTDNCECTVTCERSDDPNLDCWSDPYPVGTTTLTWTATDPTGNTASCRQTITVYDNESPGITCPPDKNVPAEQDECDAAVDPGVATCTDNCGCVAPPTCQRSDGLDCFTDRYPVGCTTLTWCASDDAGNEACCDQTVCVIDTQEPTIICPEDVKAPSDPDECGAVVDYPDPQVGDNCPGVTWECDPPSGSFFDVGTTLVTCTARDVAENATKCMFTVTVNDTEPPSVSCPADVKESTDQGECSARVYPSDTTSEDLASCTDNCSCSVVCVRNDGLALGAPYPVGTTEICCTATDSVQTDECCFNVTVNDTEPPEMPCPGPDDITVNADPGECTALVDPDPNGVMTCTDNCKCEVTCERSDGYDCWGDPYPVGTTTLTWCARDNAGNETCCPQTITVNEVTNVDIEIRSEATNMLGECQRCITFALYDCATGQLAPSFPDEHRVLTFVNGVARLNGVVNDRLIVPCGPWDCISAKDQMHSLQSTVLLGYGGAQFSANFIGEDRLLCGDANNDDLVDIVDYGILFTQYMDCRNPLPTVCNGAAPPSPSSGPYDADFDWSGCVTTGDFLCILFNFLEVSDEANASCPTRLPGDDTIASRSDLRGDGGAPGAGTTPYGQSRRKLAARIGRSTIAVEDIAHTIGMEAAMAADIDGNGVLDVADMALFSQGNSIELPERFQEIMLKRATTVEDVTPVAPRR